MLGEPVVAASLSAARFDEPGPYSGSGTPIPVASFVYNEAETLQQSVGISSFESLADVGNILTSVNHGMWTAGTAEQFIVQGTGSEMDGQIYNDTQSGVNAITDFGPTNADDATGTGGVVLYLQSRVSAWGRASQATIANMFRKRTTSGSCGIETRGTADQMPVSPSFTLNGTTGWTMILDYTPLSSHNGNLFGSTGQSVENRVQGDSNVIRFYTSAGTRSPSLTSPTSNNRRIIVIRGDSTFWRVYLNGGSGAGAAAAIGNMTIDRLNFIGSGSYGNVRIHGYRFYSSVLSIPSINTLCSAFAADSQFGSVSWTPAN